MNELIIIRHGEAEHMVKGLTGGWTDTPLTELGRRQAELTGPYLASIIAGRPCAFYSSDLLRAKETAEIISKPLGNDPVMAPELRELNNGQAKDLTDAEAQKILNPITQPLVDWPPYPGAESWRQMSERVIAFIDRIADQSDLAIIVTHGGSGNAAICWWLRLEIGEHNISFELDPCSISRFNTTKYGERNVVKLNDTAHIF